MCSYMSKFVFPEMKIHKNNLLSNKDFSCIIIRNADGKFNWALDDRRRDICFGTVESNFKLKSFETKQGPFVTDYSMAHGMFIGSDLVKSKIYLWDEKLVKSKHW